jgi:hypothetical protein
MGSDPVKRKTGKLLKNNTTMKMETYKPLFLMLMVEKMDQQLGITVMEKYIVK